MHRNHRRGIGIAPAPLNPDRDREIELYGQLYQSDRYGMGAKRQASVQRILGGLFPRGTLLDVSTGRGETLNFADRLGFEAIGTEVVEELLQPERVLYSQARKLPFANRAFDHVTCFDVLEHLIEEDVHACLAEMARVAKVSVTASASEVPSKWGARDLHISKRPAAEWEEAIRKAWGGATRIEDAGGTPCWQWRF